jgi:Na+-translocating ferredoxin:NAD+ oxidoreductase RnfC subunit
MKNAGEVWQGNKNVEPHPMYEGRRTPLKQLVKKLGVAEYDHPSEFCTDDIRVTRVEIPLSQHVGEPAQALVKPGDRVAKGQCIGENVAGKLGARVHASIEGLVKSVGAAVVIEKA